MKITQHLWFRAGMMDAVRKYVSLIPGSSIDWEMAIPGDTPAGPGGTVEQVAFTLGDQRYMALQADGPFVLNESFSIMAEVDTQAEVDRLWEALLEGGSPQQCGWLKDRWGVSWQIVPNRLGELMMSKDKQAAARVTAAMLQMVKIEVEPLEAAARG